MSNALDETALLTLISLEDRLRRLEWYLSGADEAEERLQQVVNSGRENTVPTRLARLESSLVRLSAQWPTVDALLRLRAQYPDLFQPSTSDVPTTLPTTELLSIINACTTSYPTTASRLDAIKDLPIPSTDSFASLIALHPRLAKLEIMQESHAQEMVDLRKRTASAIQRWYELRVLGESECWSEWEGRVVKAEKLVRREEKEQMREMKEKEAY